MLGMGEKGNETRCYGRRKKGGVGVWKTWARGKKDCKCTFECIYDLFAIVAGISAVGSARGRKDCKCTLECTYNLFAFLKGILGVGSCSFKVFGREEFWAPLSFCAKEW
jgi:hypothetical protein